MDNKKWKFTRAGKEESVAMEKWIWGVVYDDGTELRQFDDKGVFHQVGEIDQDRVTLWVLHKSDDINKRIDIVPPKGARLIHKYTHYIFAGGTPEETRQKAYVFGFKDGEHYLYNYVMPDDRIVQATTDNLNLADFGILR